MALGAGVVGAVIGGAIGGATMIALQKCMASIYAINIHNGKVTLDDVRPQTPEYREMVRQAYYNMYHEEL